VFEYDTKDEGIMNPFGMLFQSLWRTLKTLQELTKDNIR
jgi:hypothetical protein